MIAAKAETQAALTTLARSVLFEEAEAGTSVLAKDRTPVKNQDGDWFSQHHHSAELRLREVLPRVRRVDAVCDWPGSRS